MLLRNQRLCDFGHHSTDFPLIHFSSHRSRVAVNEKLLSSVQFAQCSVVELTDADVSKVPNVCSFTAKGQQTENSSQFSECTNSKRKPNGSNKKFGNYQILFTFCFMFNIGIFICFSFYLLYSNSNQILGKSFF